MAENGRQPSCAQLIPPHIGQRSGAALLLAPYPQSLQRYRRSGAASKLTPQALRNA